MAVGKWRDRPSRHSDSRDLRSDFGIPDETRPSELKLTAPTLRPSSPFTASPEDDKCTSAYYSKSLSVVERNYEIHDKKMLAVIELWKIVPFPEGPPQG